MVWVSWPLCFFVFLASFSALWWPNIWLKMGFLELFKTLLAQFLSYLAFILMGWVSWPLYIFVFLASFSALGWPNIWLKMGFPELFVKTICSIHFIPGIYPYGVSLLTPIHFRVPSLVCGPLVAKYLCYNGTTVSFCVFSIDFAVLWQFFLHLPNFLHKLLWYHKYHDSLVGKMMPKFFWNKVFLRNSHLCITRLQNRILIRYFWMRWVVIRAGVYCHYLWVQLVYFCS